MAKKMNGMKNDMKMQECCKMHKKIMACKMLVIGALILANSCWKIVSWANFIGGILVIAGVLKLLMPMHGK